MPCPRCGSTWHYQNWDGDRCCNMCGEIMTDETAATTRQKLSELAAIARTEGYPSPRRGRPRNPVVITIDRQARFGRGARHTATPVLEPAVEPVYLPPLKPLPPRRQPKPQRKIEWTG